MLAATLRTSRLGVSFCNFIVDLAWDLVGCARTLFEESRCTPKLCVRNASIHAPCEWNAGRAASFFAGAGESSARGPRGTETSIARASSGDPRPAEKDATTVGQPGCFSDPSPVKPQ